MGDESLFYRPKSPLLSTINTYLGGPTPARKDDPAVRFGPDGIEYHQSYGHGVTVRLGWQEVHAVAVLPGPVHGRQALCVYPFRQMPEPEGSGPGLLLRFRSLFGTPLAVHWHHVRGPSLAKLDSHLSAWTDGRIALTSERPSEAQ
ncbi:hypothetical protein LWC34_47450 [Kibdelosporangium philippinense]|uniref:Uncharacterized protein n=1 Tax=Kibdelosporangium philippinense TaxID=211113 RepID=A0ABS8ZWZ0_9PSEU|nr:hypothetical protein [Kibdelosporangium philippinense]MCE7010392.1 hypothetical protein [Kibdelosporangium philippinense]